MLALKREQVDAENLQADVMNGPLSDVNRIRFPR